ncbi:MAG: hypothetical protein ACRDPP_12560 [Gaiellaceae bacterium]
MITFVVRLWDSAEPALAAAPVRGTALHVASGQTTSFVGVGELLAIFTSVNEESPGSCGHPQSRAATAM